MRAGAGPVDYHFIALGKNIIATEPEIGKSLPDHRDMFLQAVQAWFQRWKYRIVQTAVHSDNVIQDFQFALGIHFIQELPCNRFVLIGHGAPSFPRSIIDPYGLNRTRRFQNFFRSIRDRRNIAPRSIST